MTDTNVRTILIVEDDDVARGSLARAIQDAGHQTLEAIDGKSALEVSLEKHPDLILSDNLLPELKGTEFLTELRKDEWGRKVPFILLTSQYNVEAVNNSLEAGNTDFLVKDDTTLSGIIETIERHFVES